jgi:hypothetical protein
MASELEKEVCRFYNVSEKRISNKKLLNILELIIIYFGKITFNDCENFVCNYSMSSEIPTNIQRDEEDYPFIGTGYTIKDVILTQILDEECIDNRAFFEAVRDELTSPLQKLANFLWG